MFHKVASFHQHYSTYTLQTYHHQEHHQQRPLHNKHSQIHHTLTTTDIKTNMRHVHISIVSRHLPTRGNNKILRTPPPHICGSEEILPRLTRRTLAQLRTNKSSFLKSYLHKVDAKSHPSPLCPLCNTHTRYTSSLQLHPHTHPWICGQTPPE